MRFEKAAEDYHAPDEEEDGDPQRPARHDRLQSLPSEKASVCSIVRLS